MEIIRPTKKEVKGLVKYSDHLRRMKYSKDYRDGYERGVKI